MNIYTVQLIHSLIIRHLLHGEKIQGMCEAIRAGGETLDVGDRLYIITPDARVLSIQDNPKENLCLATSPANMTAAQLRALADERDRIAARRDAEKAAKACRRHRSRSKE